MQIQLKHPDSKHLENREQSTDPSVIEDIAIENTYGKEGWINIYNQDRHSAMLSFSCYWSIDHMARTLKFMSLPVQEKCKDIVVEMLAEDEADEITGLNLKKEFIVPQKFF